MPIVTTPALAFEPFFATTPPAPAAYATIAVATTQPAADGVIRLKTIESESPFSFGKILFYANGTAGASFKAKIVGWQRMVADWIPITLADVTCTIGSAVRSTGEKIVSGITANNIVANSEIVIADNNVQVLKLDLMGVEDLQLVPGPIVSGTVTSIGAGLSGF